MFQGRSALTLDGKGRLSIPVKVRELLTEPERAGERVQITITRHSDKCLLLFPQDVWVGKKALVEKLPEDMRWFRRLFVGSAATVELDGANRVLVAPELREAAGLTRDVVLIGMGDQLELWDAQTLKWTEDRDLTQSQGKTLPMGFSL